MHLDAHQSETASLQPALAEQIYMFIESHGVSSEKAQKIENQEIPALKGHV